METIKKILMFPFKILGGFAHLILISGLFCLLSGIPFFYFWSVVFKVLKDTAIQYFTWITTPGNIEQFQQWFRQMVFGG